MITADDAHVHVSGHPARDELRQMYQWARPRIAVPVHGERRHILEHVKLAQSLQVPEAIAPSNGDLIRLAPGPAVIIDEVPAGRLYVDGNSIIEAEDERSGIAAGSPRKARSTSRLRLSAKKRNIVAGPNVTVRGLSMADEEDFEIALEELEDAAEAAFTRLNHAERDDDEAVRGRRRARRAQGGRTALAKRPLVDVTVLRI